jgi:autotransporter-associated beta strand protein
MPSRRKARALPPNQTVMKFHPRTRLAALSTFVLLSLIPAPLIHAASTLTWATSASGTWDTSNASAWNPGPVAWSSATNTTDIASFGSGPTYTVTLATNTPVYLGGITVVTGGDVIIGTAVGSSLNLNGSAINAVGSLTVNTVINGSSGLTKTGGGTLFLAAANTYTGGTTLSAGQITLKVSNAINTTTALAMSSGTNFTMQGFSQTLSGLSGAGTVRTTSASTSKVTISGGTTDTFSGSISDGATGGVALSFERGGTGTTNLTGTSSYRGTTTVSGGVLALGSNLSGTSSVTVSGGTLTSSVGNVNLGLGTVSMTGGVISANGTSIGSFTLASGQNFTATLATLNFTLGASNTSDQIIGSGLFDLSNVTLALDGTTSVAGSYTLFSGFTGGTNIVSSVTITGLAGGFTGSLGTNGVLTVSAIPEPSTVATLLGVAALGIAVLRRRHARA